MCTCLSARLVRNHEHTAGLQYAVYLCKAACNLRPEIHRLERRHNVKLFILKGQLQYIPLDDRAPSCLNRRTVHLPRLFHGDGRVVQPRHMPFVHHPQEHSDVRPAAAAAVKHLLIPLQVEMRKAPRRNARMTAIHHGDDKFPHLPLRVSHIAEKFTKQAHAAPPFC